MRNRPESGLTPRQMAATVGRSSAGGSPSSMVAIRSSCRDCHARNRSCRWKTVATFSKAS